MFHDGTEFQADAVKANFDRVTNKENALRRYSLYNNIAKTEVVDPYTARITLRKPFSAFINQIAHPAGVMICPKALAAYPGKQIAFHPCGTGPYTVKEYNPSEILHVVKNPNYWQKGLPKLDGITFKPVPENSTRVAMLRTGEAQFIFPVPPEQVKSLEGESGIEVTVSPSIIERYIAFNTKMKPFDNPKVRLALNYAVNKQALCKVAFNGLAVPATGLAPEGVDYAKQFEAIPYDPKKARELLLPERLHRHPLVALQPYDRPEGDPVPAAAVRSGRRQGFHHGDGIGPENDLSPEEARGSKAQHALHGLVILDGRTRLGRAAASCDGILGAGCRELRLLFERRA